jgi:hypothetical protein
MPLAATLARPMAALTTGRTHCRILLNGRPCRALPVRGADYCIGHRRHRLADASVTLAELWRLAEEPDQRSAEAGELYPAVKFVAWVKPDLDGMEC